MRLRHMDEGERMAYDNNTTWLLIQKILMKKKHISFWSSNSYAMFVEWIELVAVI